MSFQNIPLVRVSFLKDKEKIFMGRLALRNRKIFFEYQPEFIKTGLELSPFKLPLKPGIQESEGPIFDGLFGLFNDSLPDGWGRLLLDRKLMMLNHNPGEFSPLDRLCYVGHHGMGALVYEPEAETSHLLHSEDLDEIANIALQFQQNDDERFIDDLLAMNGSSAGTRPKMMITKDGEDWIIKFSSPLDPKDIGPIEYAYHLMAKEAGLDVPLAKVFPSKNGPGYFGVKRFDRAKGKRLHMHSISGLLHVDHRIPSLDYEIIIKATRWLSRDSQASEKQFRACVFNVLSHNRDDHAKNFSFLMNESGKWQVSPSYDLTFSSGPVGEHCSMIMGEGKNPTQAHLLKLAEIAEIEKQKALQIINEVEAAVSKWKEHAKTAGVYPASLKRIQMALNHVKKML